MVKATTLTKKFDDFVAVNAVDFEIFKGENFGFLGPNGAGKTTTMNMIQGISPLTGGKLTVDGKDISNDARDIKYKIGVAPQEESLGQSS